MRLRSIVPHLLTIATLATTATGCSVKDPLFCDPAHPCVDPSRPYCDLYGAYPASDHIGNTCIASPFDAGVPDAAVADAALIDAAVDATTHARTDARPADAMTDAQPCVPLISFQDTGTSSALDLFTMTASGGSATNLTMVQGDDLGGAWAPDGHYLAFTGDHDLNNQYEAYVIAKSGSGLTNVSQNGAKHHSGPFAWSPDGAHVAFQRFNDATVDYDIVRVDRNGSNLIDLTPDTSFFDTAPAWSPDGTKIAFQRRVTGAKDQIYTMNAATGQAVTQLTFDTTNAAAFPRGSPDGLSILFDRANSLYTMSSSGTNVTLLHHGSGGSWSHAGDRIAFTDAGDAYSISPNGAALFNMTTGTSTSVDGATSWAPDDKQILVHIAGTPGAVGVVPYTGSTVTSLHAGSPDEFQPMCQ